MDNNYAQFLTESLRFAILQLLYSAPAYSLNEFDLKSLLAHRGQATSSDSLRVQLHWLHDQQLIHAQHEADFWTAQLITRGGDVVNGLCTVPGVAKPEPHSH